MHTSTGQEAAGIGATAALRPGDVVTLTHRPHAQYVGMEIPLGPCIAEMAGRATGLSGGRAGHMIIADATRGVLGASGVVGHSLLLAVGHGYAHKLAGRGAVTLCVTGDGAVNSGAFNEALNMAALWQLPVIFVVENNQYGLTVRLDRHVHETTLAARGRGYGIPGTRVDGNDVEEVHRAVREAADRARSGGGPALIEAVTYRTGPFSMSDRGGYRIEAEGSGFTDPLELSAQRLRDRGVAASRLEEIDRAVAGELAEAIEFALSSPWPDPADLTEHIQRWDGVPA
ncbi:pyruvate dehydrogenase E1 component alpha subunit [Catenuloplanes atrovinosus]|uniref:Pyruvate dehydrogenase E1 component alpha subunit n=2 Tax=Catenuloplanes atrovinosus TaxID=137266 RepID=A0AAE3YM69_9ACTN|nr:pyruvate dehydrogenase E1 component alpha subunit [Catenuloplanes atrovinosus]